MRIPRPLRALRLRLATPRRTSHLPDLSRSYMNPGIPAKQRELVDRQLQDMYAGDVPAHFHVLADVLQEIGVSPRDRGEPLTLLDAGCASAYYFEILTYLLPLHFEYWGVDFNEAMLELAHETYPHLTSRLARMDLRRLGWPNQSFDVVLSGAVIVHVREWKKAVAELARVASKWVVLHRTLVCFDRASFARVKRHYDVDVYRVHIQEAELISLLRNLGYGLISRLDCDEGIAGRDVGNYTYLFQRENRSHV